MARADQTNSISFYGFKVGSGGHPVRNNGVELLKGAETDNGGVSKFTLIRHQNHTIPPLDYTALDFRLQIGAVGQPTFKRDAGGRDKDGLNTQAGEGIQC